MKALAPNTLLQNRYLVVHLIGKGGMGDVYLAVDQRLGSAVALKRTFFSDDETFGNAFEREAKTLARLRHPVLTKVSDHFSENDVLFLVMEHISGDDLSKRLEAAQKPFPLSWVLFWADQLLDALAYLHAHEPPIIHRDIKPQNLKLTEENSIILLDFGLSKNTEGDTIPIISGGASSTGSVVGYTPHYAPMEQIRGTGTNPRSDIYALSATLYQLLTNVIPFDALTRADALLNGMEDPITSISDINPEVPLTVSAVILKGMELSQDRRFSDAREMQKALRGTFALIQTSMTAQTVAFNVQDEQAVQPSILPDLPMPENPAVLNTSENQSLLPSGSYNWSAPQKNSSSLKTPNPVQEPNFDATLRMDMPPVDSFPKQSDVKTEVFLAGSAPLIPPAESDFSSFNKNKENSAHGESFKETVTNENEEFSPTEDYGDNSFTGSEENNAPDDVPLFSADNQTDYISNLPADSAFYSSSQIQQEADAFSTYTPVSSYSEEDFSDEKIPQEKINRDDLIKSQPPPAKTSSRKAAMVVGGIFALFVLFLSAAGAGWFVYNKYYVASVKKPTPTPMPSIEFSPTPAPTVEVVIQTNTNSADNSNSEVVSSNTNIQTNSLSNNSTNTIAGNTRVSQPTPQTVVTPKPPPPQVAVKNTPKTKPTPAVKPSVKPTGKKPDAPIILQ